MPPLLGFAFSAQSLAFLKTVPLKHRKQIVAKAQSLLSNPIPPGSKQLQNMMEGDNPIRRIRSGDYRILYVVKSNPDQVVIVDIGHRKDVYR